jgi:DNA-binding NarL/FixJ family response regulator
MTTDDKKIRLLVVDDHHIIRVGLKTLLDAQSDMEVVGEAADGRAAVEAFGQLKPDVVIMDLRLPDMDGPLAIAAILKEAPQAGIVVLTSYEADEEAYRAVQAGARGYVLKGMFAEGLLEAIRHVHAGGTLIPPDLAVKLEKRGSTVGLSARERQVLELVAKGLINKEIAAVLMVSEDTVKTHLKRIYAKLDVTDRTEAALVAVQRGILRI